MASVAQIALGASVVGANVLASSRLLNLSLGSDRLFWPMLAGAAAAFASSVASLVGQYLPALIISYVGVEAGVVGIIGGISMLGAHDELGFFDLSALKTFAVGAAVSAGAMLVASYALTAILSKSLTKTKK